MFFVLISGFARAPRIWFAEQLRAFGVRLSPMNGVSPRMLRHIAGDVLVIDLQARGQECFSKYTKSNWNGDRTQYCGLQLRWVRMISLKNASKNDYLQHPPDNFRGLMSRFMTEVMGWGPTLTIYLVTFALHLAHLMTPSPILN